MCLDSYFEYVDSYYEAKLGLIPSAAAMMACFIGSSLGRIYFCVHDICLSAG